MQKIEYVKVDYKDRRPTTEFPARHGPDDPITGIDQLWYERGNPTRYYGLAPDDADLSTPGILREIPLEEWSVINQRNLNSIADKKRDEIEQARKMDEAEGVTINSVRYSGSPANRQSLADALDLADEEGMTEFAPWKDSDDVFHSSVTVADIRSARSQIIKRRAELIAKEDAKYQEIDAALKDDDRDTLRAISWQ